MQILIQLIFFLEDFLWMQGILQMKITVSYKRLLSAGAVGLLYTFLIGFGIFGENLPPFSLFFSCILCILLFEEKPSHVVCKYFFAVFYMGMFATPIQTLTTIGQHCGLWNLTNEPKILPEDIFLLLIIPIMGYLVQRYPSKCSWFATLPIHHYALGALLAFSTGLVASFTESISKQMPTAAFIVYEIIFLVLREFMYVFGILLAYLTVLQKQNRAEISSKNELLTQAQTNVSALNSQIREVRKIRHDMKYHLTALYQLLKHQDYDRALTLLESTIEHTDNSSCQKIDTGNALVNAVLQAELDKMPQDTTLLFHGAIPETCRIKDFDLCTIFSNLLSNAREACERLTSREKEISLQISQHRTGMRIEISNPIEEKIDVKKIGTFTSKGDRVSHGFGLINVQETVKKYNGDISFSVDDGRFHIVIYI